MAGALSVYAGFPEVAYIDALLAVFWIGWRAGCLGRRRLRAFAAKAATGGVVGALLAAPLLIAFLGYVDDAYVGGHANGYYGSIHLQARRCPSSCSPTCTGRSWASPIRSGSSPVSGEASADTSPRRCCCSRYSASCRRGGAGCGGCCCLDRARARSNVRPATRGGPGARRTARHVAGVLQPVRIRVARARNRPPGRARAGRPGTRARDAPAPGGGWSDLTRARGGRGDRRPTARRPARKLFSDRHYYEAAVVWGTGVVLTGAAAALVRSSRTRAWLVALLVAGDALVLFAVPELSAPRGVKTRPGSGRLPSAEPRQLALLHTRTAAAQLRRVFRHCLAQCQRRPGVQRLRTLRPHAAGPDRGSQASHRDPPRWSASTLRNASRSFCSTLAGYRAAGVAYVLTPRGQALPASPAYKLVFRSPSARIYRVAGAAPYFTATNPGCRVTPRAEDPRGSPAPPPPRSSAERPTFRAGAPASTAIRSGCARPTASSRRSPSQPARTVSSSPTDRRRSSGDTPRSPPDARRCC